MTTTHEYRAPALIAELVSKYVPRDARILDAGAGTGLSGEVLAAAGYGDLVAMDLSEGMLEVARSKGVYKEARRMALGEHLDFETGTFGAMVAVGVFTQAHAPASAFDELVRVTRPGGHVAFTLSVPSYEGAGFKEKFAELESAGKWKLTDLTGPQQLTQGGAGVEHQAWVWEVAS